MLKISKTHYIDEFEKGPIRRSLFTNGAVSLFHHASNFSGAKVQLHFLAGSMFESADQHGLSHLIEHLAFKDYETNIIRTLELMGAQLNAYTYKENVCFEMSCVSSKLEHMLPMFLGNFLNINFSDIELSKEKEVIMQELRDDLDDHETQAVEYAFRKNFDEHIGHPIGGNISQVKKYKRKDVESYYKKYYRPDRMILVVVAGTQFDQLEDIYTKQMNQFYKFSAKKPFRLQAKNKLTNLKHFQVKIKKKMENGLLVFSFDGPSLNSSSYYDFIVLDELLFEGMSSIFFRKLREDKPLVYGYGSSINCFSKSGNYLMIFNAQKKNLTKVRAACKEVIDYYCEHSFDVEDIELVKSRVLDSWELSFDDLDERVEFIAGSEIYQLDEFSVLKVKAKIQQTSPESIQKIFKKIKSTQYSELLIEPN